PGGTVQFKVDGSNFGSPVTLNSGSAQILTSTLSVANHTVSADYTGTGSFNSSSGSLTGGQVVNKANTSTALVSDHNPSVYKQLVTFTATVTVAGDGGRTPAGSVQFKHDGANMGAPVALDSGGVSSFSIDSLAVHDLAHSSHALTAEYLGNASYNGSTSNTVSQVVNKAKTSPALLSYPNSPFSTLFRSFTATVTVAGDGGGTPAGSVQFKHDGANMGAPVALDSGG